MIPHAQSCSKSMPHVLAVMTPFPHTIEEDAPLSEAKTLMYQKEIRHLPVLRGGRLVGILSDRDMKLVHAVAGIARDLPGDATAALKVSDACNYDAYIVESEERLDTVVAYMAERRIGSALVARGGKLVGIFTATDACRELAELLRHHYPDA